MVWKDYRKKVAVGLWALVCLLFAPSVYHLATYSLPESETLVCYPEFNPEYYGTEYEESYEILEQEFLARLRDSDDPNAQLMGILADRYGKVGAEDIGSIAELAQQFPTNGFILVELITACFEDLDHESCLDQNLTTNISQQEANAAVWGELAMLRAQREDVFGAARALQQAILAPEFDDYFSLQISTLDSTATNDDPMAKLNTVFRSFRYTDSSIGHAIGFSPSFFCANESGSNPDIAQTCLAYGKLIEDQSDTNIGEMIGLAIQEVTYEAMGDRDGVAEMRARAVAAQDSRYAITRRSSSAVGLTSYDDSLAEYWVENLINVGEMQARRLLDEEVARRLADPEYRPCNPPGIRFEFPYFYYGDEPVQWY